MAGLPVDHDKARIEALQMASINMESRLLMVENLMKDEYGRIAVNQDDLMNQLMSQSIAAGMSFDYAAMEKIKEMMEDATRGARIDGVRAEDYATKKQSYVDQYGTEKTNPYGTAEDVVSIRKSRTPPGGLGFPGTSGVVGSTGVSRVGVDAEMIDTIIAIRNKLDDFLDGSNVLIKVMNPQTIREMVRELRHEIREIKRDHGISELAIIEHLEKELEVETDRRADAQSAIDRYDRDNEVPF